ncbi:TPA: hypothetical protein UZ441_001094 [Escherichia coli]|nr:hypothetical protein [Escherichia coli]HEL8041130.1 hypothetical protein [Escherichia coli]HEL8046684.1 hypothetical protein [Escherichia coli]HEL8050970.1 hypothetical protein [Escherichia coli]HEL8058812.1 hypothetical protein [Escherichia coli]
MCNKNTPDAAAEAIKTLMHALIDINYTAWLAKNKKDAVFISSALESIQIIAEHALNKSKNILVADIQGVSHA